MNTEPKPKKARAPKTAAPAKTTSPELAVAAEQRAESRTAIAQAFKFQERYLELLEKSSKSQEKSAEALYCIAEVLGIFADEKLDTLEASNEEQLRERIKELEHITGVLEHQQVHSDERIQELQQVIERLEAEKIELVASDPERAALFDALGSINPFVHVLARTNQIYPQLVTETDPDAIGRIPALPLAIQDYSTRINSPLPKRYELAIEAAARMMIYASDLFDQMKDAMPEPEPETRTLSGAETPGPKVVQDEETTSETTSPEAPEGKTEGGAE